LYLLYCPHNTTSLEKRIKNLFKSPTTFAKCKPSHTETCEAICETNPIVCLRNKRHLTAIPLQFASQRYRKQSYLTRQKLNFIRIFTGKKWKRGRVLTNVALRPGMPPWLSLWVVGGTSFTRSAALRNFNGGSPTSSTTNWHSTSFSSSAFRSWLDLPDSLAFLALANCSVISFSYLVAFNCTSDW
jgi:hypothetical protein